MRERGFTLLEVIIAVTLVGLVALGLLFALRVGFNAMQKSNDKLMHNRRVTGVEHILEQQVAGIIPVTAACAGEDPQGQGEKVAFFQGEAGSMRFVSAYSLQEGGRGVPRILEYQAIPGVEGIGARLVLNELLYSGPLSTAFFCTGKAPNEDGGTVPVFRPIAVGPASFVLADRLSVCRFAFLQPPKDDKPAKWVDHWTKPTLPTAIHMDLEPLVVDASSMQLLPLTIPVRITREPLGPYAQ